MESTEYLASSTLATRRLLRGCRAHDNDGATIKLPSKIQVFEDSFQLEDYLNALIRFDHSNVEALIASPFEPRLNWSSEYSADKEESMNACWIYEHLRRLCLDLNLWIIPLLANCTKETCIQMLAKDWVFVCSSHETERNCCAIDYIVHAIEGATALLNSTRYFPSRITIEEKNAFKHFESISRRLYRILAHTYFHHRKIFDELEFKTSLHRRFHTLCESYKLVESQHLLIPVVKKTPM